MVEKFKSIRAAYVATEKELQAKLEKVRERICLFDQMIEEEEGVPAKAEKAEMPVCLPTEEVVCTPVEEKKDDIIEIHL